MKKFFAICLSLVLCAGALAACATSASSSEMPDVPSSGTESSGSGSSGSEYSVTPLMEITSAGITDGVLADKYGMRGAQLSGGIPTLSPPLTVSNIPENTAALAVMLTDPDGEDWVHWLCCFVPEDSHTANLPENASIAKAEILQQGKNDFGTVGYGGPTPPGGVHKYVFTVYALADVPALKEGFDREDLTDQLNLPGMTLATATVTGTYAH